MSALSLKMNEANKWRRSLRDGFPKPQREKSPASSLFKSKAPSGFFSDANRYDITPLPSPIVSSKREISAASTPNRSPNGSKTNAFFGAGWESRSSTPAPPPPVQRAVSHQPDATNGLPRPKPYATLDSLQPQDGSSATTPIHIIAPTPRVVSDSYAPSRTRTQDFFNTPKYIPTPPPSIHSLSSSPEHASSITLPRSGDMDTREAGVQVAVPESSIVPTLRIPRARFSPTRITGDGKGHSSPTEGVLDNDAALHPLSSLSSSLSSNSGHTGTGNIPSVLSSPHADTSFTTQETADLSGAAASGSDLSRSSSSRSSVSDHGHGNSRHDYYLPGFTSVLHDESLSQPPFALHTPPVRARIIGRERENNQRGARWKQPETDDGSSHLHLGVNTVTPIVAVGETSTVLESPKAFDATPAEYLPAPVAEIRRPGSIRPPSAVRRETHRTPASETPVDSGTIIGGGGGSAGDVPLELIRPLGQGAFSSVWLALDVEGKLSLRRTASTRKRRRQSVSIAKKSEDNMQGLKPTFRRQHLNVQRIASQEHSGAAETLAKSKDRTKNVLDEGDGKGAHPHEGLFGDGDNSLSLFSRPIPPSGGTGKVVAVKMMDRALCDTNDRTRISFVREVEVLRVSNALSIIGMAVNSFPRSISRILQSCPTFIRSQRQLTIA